MSRNFKSKRKKRLELPHKKRESNKLPSKDKEKERRPSKPRRIKKCASNRKSSSQSNRRNYNMSRPWNNSVCNKKH